MITTLYDDFVTIFGSYSPITGTDYQGNPCEFTDWSYIFACGFALVVCYGVLRIVGNMFGRKR